STSVSPTDLLGNFPQSAAVNTLGFASILGTLDTAGAYTLTAGGASTNVTVTPAGASFFTVTAPPAATTGIAFNITVKAFDRFGNPDTDYAGTISMTSSDPAAAMPVPSYTFTPGEGGVHTFSIAL